MTTPFRSAILLLLLGAASVATPQPAPLPPVAPSAPPVDETLVPYASMADSPRLADGRVLHLVCMGQGAPTVILTAGLNSWSGEWSRVQPAVATQTRSCAWDRPGYGLSDGRADRMTVETTLADLRAALAARGIGGPYVLVGASLGAFETLLFADRDRAEVAGMVLVDPSFPDQVARARRLANALGFKPPVPPSGTPQPPTLSDIWQGCAQAVRSGALKPGGPDPQGCLAVLGPPIPPIVRAAVGAKLTASPLGFATMAAFSRDALAEGSRIVVDPAREYGAMPLIVLTATAFPKGAPESQRAFVEATMAESSKAHDELAALSTCGINARVPGADHNIHIERPQIVIDAIAAVVAQTRAAARR